MNLGGLHSRCHDATVGAPRRVVLLSGPEDDCASEPAMKFRLYYEGELRPTGGDPLRHQSDPLAAHKHRIRQEFHKQLKRLWETNRFLRERKVFPGDFGISPAALRTVYDSRAESDQVPWVDVVAAKYGEYGYRFVPLVQESLHMLCSLDILFLRRDIPGGIITSAGDIDNRIKTVIDGLRRPRNATELAGNEKPNESEDPFFCLLEDDSQVSHLSVETDTLLDPITGADADHRKVRLVITVELRPY